MIHLRRSPPPEVSGLATNSREREARLSKARAFVATLSLVAISLDPTEPRRFAALAYGLLLVYVVYSLLLVALLARIQSVTRTGRVAVHAVDIGWAAVISLFTGGPDSPFFLFFFFVLLAAAYRWGFRRTLLTAGLAVAILAAEAALLNRVAGGGPGGGLEGHFELNRFLMRATYLLVAGYLFGYLGDSERRAHREASVIAGTLVKVRAEAGVRETLRVFFDDLIGLFDASQVLLAIRETQTGRAYLWRRQPAWAQGPAVEGVEIDDARQDSYLFPLLGEAWRWTGPGAARAERPGEGLVLDERGQRLQCAPLVPPPELLTTHPCRAMLATSFLLGREWSGRLFLLDPPYRGDGDLRFLHRIVRHVAPAIENVYLLSRLRTRAGAIERARVARELHDGVIQSLIGLEMQVDVLKRQAAGEQHEMAGSLAKIQGLLRNEVLAVRELMEQMRPVDVGPAEILGHLASLVDRFQRETGITARFASQLPEVTLSPRVCREIARIVQEALVNIRKHSGARQAVVRFGREKGRWTLVIDDDGRGFDFAGRLSQAELDAARQGPLVIKERVRSAGGELAIESSPGRGSRLEIWLPERAAHA
jgi:signal transduction histidine kinase